MGVRVASGKALVLLVSVFIICAGGGMVISPAAAEEVHLVPAVYVFGDSTVDVGNLKYLPGNFTLPYPYGIDFPLANSSRPNGRFSNGYNLADCISRLLGFDMSPPAYLSLTPETSGQILKGFGGANYAAGGSGILDATGNASLPLSKQVELFAATKAKMTEDSGDNGAQAIDALLSRSLFLISDGGNDMFDFFLKKRSPFEVPAFYKDLLSNYTKYVKTLYGLGARRFGVINVAPIGCAPAARARSPFGDGYCEFFSNKLARDFDSALGDAMANLAASLPGMKYSVGSPYQLVEYYTAHPEAAGFKVVNSACCGGGKLNAETPCGSPNTTYCAHRDEHMFWDMMHGTQATWIKGAADIYDAPVERGFTSPINFKQLLLDDERAVSAANLLVSV
ncbi:GDSL esterase/lipase APG-like [Triticum dicoccoides]|uniref:GDSL esterase/lipase APG-like n=1 Tax=Triticum dicoccoides TaxID=85692 RepID=UPI001890F0D0|nr:GDSL esterase/lipase APG-like [Triticum dicoccoides]